MSPLGDTYKLTFLSTSAFFSYCFSLWLSVMYTTASI